MWAKVSIVLLQGYYTEIVTYNKSSDEVSESSNSIFTKS